MWEFDKSVAERFQQEAEQNIPDYRRVIELCWKIADYKQIPHDAVIVDVGSALGETLYEFKANGYTNVWGIESSEAMRDASMYKENVILSETYPNLKADMIMMNWTLHFVTNKYAYLKEIYRNLNDNGVFVLTDKTNQSPMVKEFYYDFKRDRGVSNEYIVEKEKQLQGYMKTEDFAWYYYTLSVMGFKNVQLINSSLGFSTFYCEK
jgi:SAM-dependent methyltransferase